MIHKVIADTQFGDLRESAGLLSSGTPYTGTILLELF